MTDKHINKIIQISVGNGYSIKRIESKKNHQVYLCSAKEPNEIPSKIIVAVNKITGKIGSSLTSTDDAISYCK